MNHERPQRNALGAFVNYRTNCSPFEKGKLTEGIDPTAKTHSPADRVGYLKTIRQGDAQHRPYRIVCNLLPLRGASGRRARPFLSAGNGWKYVPEKRRMGAIVNINAVDTGIIQGVIRDLSTLSTGFSTGKRKKVPVGTAFFKKL